MRTSIRIGILAALFLAVLAGSAVAGIVDLENGADGQVVQGPPEVIFNPAGGSQWVYGDWTLGSYNGPYPDGAFFSNGDYFIWMGTTQGWGMISFAQGVFATYFTIGYSTQKEVVLQAYDINNNLLDEQTGAVNLGTGQLDFVSVHGAQISYVKILEGTDYGNFLIIDDISTDATSFCTEDSHCDDAIFCNGQEICVDSECQPPVEEACADDDLYCNGEESCNEEEDVCEHTGDPCPTDDDLFCNGDYECAEDTDECLDPVAPCLSDQECDEDADECIDAEETPGPGAGPTDLWPTGEVTGGCCGC